MNRIICDIHNAEQNSRKTVKFLTENSSYSWIGEYPVALVNEKTRITDKETLTRLEEIVFFDEQGFSKSSYTKKEISFLKENTPEALKTSYCICLKKPQADSYTFKEKFEHDRWKKIQDDSFNMEAFVESSKFSDADDSETIETHLRDIMRSAKEIPALKAIGFVWIVTIPKATKVIDILEHYFGDNHIFIEKGRKITYIAWDERLANINMRYFVNTP